jgi:hypothetical protein
MRLPLTTEPWRCPQTCRVNDSVPKYVASLAAREKVMTAIKHLTKSVLLGVTESAADAASAEAAALE